MAPDPKLLELASESQKRAYLAYCEHGSYRAAEQALGLGHDAVRMAIKRLENAAARVGHAPGHFTGGVAPGYNMGKVTIQRMERDEEGRLLGVTWERMHPEAKRLDEIIERCEERLQDFPRFAPIPAPAPASAPLTNFLGLFDLHIGEKISSDDPQGRWDIATAKATITGTVAHAIAVAPKAKRMVLCFGGDAAHYDGLLPVTPKSRHVLHSDGDFDDMVDAVLDVAVFSIDLALRTHEEVHLIWAEGNHDEASSVWMRKMLARIYADEPRLTVVQSKVPYYALLFGKVMICVHHGHGAKLTNYAGIFAAMFRSMWGQATYAYAHRGHEHHIHEKEKDGMLSTQHPSLAPSDDYALGMGLVSRRGCMLITYHDEYGEVARNTTRPEMLGLDALAA
jgi:hypothetical protein